MCTHQALSEMLSQVTLAILFCAPGQNDVCKTDELPQGPSASTASGTSYGHKTLNTSLSALSIYSHQDFSPANHFKLQKHIPISVLILEVCLQTEAGQRGIPWSDVPAEKGWPHQDEVAGNALRVLPWAGGTHAHTTAHVCTHTGSVCTNGAHCWPDLHTQAAAAHQLEQG